ncbi:MAG: hypothetical protein R3Y11_07850 [Pseudomonadota bacterium]
MPINISGRVKKVSSTYYTTQKEFGDALGVNGDTFLGYFKKGREDNLLPLLPKMLELHPNINKYWLYFGEGPMSSDIAYNAQKKRTGDLLATVLGFLEFSNQEISKRSGIPLDTLDALLASRQKLTFEHLETLYIKLGINPAYFFDGNEKQMCKSKDPLLQLYYALGMQGIEPNATDIAHSLGIPFDEAEAFMQEWRDFRQKGMERVLPERWIAIIEEQAQFDTGWLKDGNPPVITFASRKQSVEKYEKSIALLQKEIADLKEKCELQRDLIAMYKERNKGETMFAHTLHTANYASIEEA